MFTLIGATGIVVIYKTITFLEIRMSGLCANARLRMSIVKDYRLINWFKTLEVMS
jgi:hypothetical protein